MSQIQGAGGQPQKSPKYAPIYTGRVFSGLYTNRSPLRGSLPSMYEQFYKLSYGDVMIDGSNVEVSNRLTLVRRPGNSVFSASSWSDVLAFDEFRVNKAASDAWGTLLEEIFTMVAEPGALYASLNGTRQFVFSDPAVTGQTYMQAVGNSLYFSNGVDNKKWLQSLIDWAPNFNPQGSNGLAGTYPFLTTYLLTGAVSATVNIQQIQQFIGIAVANITNVAVSGGVLTLTINNTGIPNTAGAVYPLSTLTNPPPVFQLWGLSTATWLNGASITPLQVVTLGTTTTVTAKYTAPTADQTYAPTADTGWLQQIGTTPVVAVTGSVQPTWGTSSNYVANTNSLWGAPVADGGNFVIDGNLLWVNRGSNVENWGLAAPPNAVTTSETNSTFASWQPDTYYSLPGFVIYSGNIYQITAAGTTGATFGSGTATFNLLQSVASAVWAASTLYNDGQYAGAYPWTPGSVVIDDVTYAVGQYVPNEYNDSGKSLVIALAGGVPCLFQCQRNIAQGNSSPVNVPLSVTYGGGASGHIGWSAAFYNHAHTQAGGGIIDLIYGGSVGNPNLYGTSTPAPYTTLANGLTSLMWNFFDGASSTFDTLPMALPTITSGGEMNPGTQTTPFAMGSSTFEILQWGEIRIPEPGMNVTFTLNQSNASWFGIAAAAGATLVSFTATEGAGGNGAVTNLGFIGGRTVTPWNGYPIVAGFNEGNNAWTMQVTVNFPNAGVFGIEFCFGNVSNGNHNFYSVFANNSLIVPEGSTTQPWFRSATTTPAFGSTGFTTAPAAQNTYPNTPELTNNPAGGYRDDVALNQGLELLWLNLGPTSSFAWQPNINVALPDSSVIELGDEFFAYESGVTAATQPSWNTGIYTITPDVQPLNWINEGTIPPITPAAGAILATSTQGWLYWIAQVNSIDNTVSNLSPVSIGTGPVNGQVNIPAGSGLTTASIDPQTDYIAIFRSTDGGATPLLDPGLGNSYWTVPLTQYLQDGFIDSTPDADLDDLITGAEAGENTPPLPGAGALTYHLGRIFFAIGNTVFYTTGASAPSGNGLGISPLNQDVLPSRVVRLVPTAIGLLVFTASDIYIIAGNGTASNPILPAIPYEQGIGLANYNALDINGVLIGFFTTDKQFLIFDPSAGLSYVGNPIGDRFRQNTGKPGTSWDTATVSVTWYTNGEDQGWFVADGQYGWYKLINTPSPESGISWSPFATIVGGVSVIQSVETTPGVHSLLLGPLTTGSILMRDLGATTDGGTNPTSSAYPGVPYPAYGVFGSYVLALPGQVAKVAFITSVSVRTGSPLVLGLLLDEALPYYQGSFDLLKRWETDPPNLPPSKSFYKQRFYLSEDHDETAYVSDMQIMFQWPAEAAQNELQTFSIFGAYEVEQ